MWSSATDGVWRSMTATTWPWLASARAPTDPGSSGRTRRAPAWPEPQSSCWIPPRPDVSLRPSFRIIYGSHSFIFIRAVVSGSCEDGIRPSWLLWLTITLGVLFLIMLLMNIFLCTAMSCSCANTEVINPNNSTCILNKSRRIRTLADYRKGAVDHRGVRSLPQLAWQPVRIPLLAPRQGRSQGIHQRWLHDTLK